MSPPLVRGQDHTFRFDFATLQSLDDSRPDKLAVVCRGHRGRIFVVQRLGPGKYQVRLTCEHNGRSVTTPPVTVEIK